MAKKHAAEMLFTGEFIEARQAADIGLVNRCVADADLDTQIELMSDNIAAKSGHALASGKALLSQLRNVSLSSAYAHASQTMACDMQSEDAQSGIKAFLEKKTPQTWKHQ